MKKLVLTVNSRDYTITLEDDFAVAFEEDLVKFLDGKRSFAAKELLTAFIYKCQEQHFQELELKNLIKSINKELG